ncbi:TonB-linked outer membrane protein, SusC/RagA family [Catalinimonas alkaloidigena]|uniref:TonB-linked outer membrane protein, SusC/RagA family n=1 Tax=Catalinimonas alkaloidigena TaxID=1075417 RepID=A0A1G9HY57_9BACT|nr:TonB-dependent receptor [Catalinimonas alkaloidigena]SDL17901.1 TonB-linked outer membrane protein, SusC/RagA family [Catalinimonas alkaloidigena]
MKTTLQRLLLHHAKLFLLLSVLQLGAVTALYAQEVNVTGRVTGSDEPGGIPGVNIIVKGTASGAVTDIDGRYDITVPTGATLVFSAVGYVTEERVVNNQATIDVVLASDIANLEEVVVVGYGTQTRRELTGSIASVSSKEIERAPVADVSQALKGKLPGVNITTQDGRPGADVAIRVRGGGSISQSNQPLFIVDGFPVTSISDIPGSQIESIDVLKDAASTAIYGARGANGVIIVTTKSGREGQMKISYDGYGQVNAPTRYFETMSARDYIEYNWAYAAAISDGYADAWEMLWGIGRYADDYNNTTGNGGLDYYNNIGSTNFSKEVYGPSFSQNHTVSLMNGTDKTKYLVSVNYVDDNGMKVNSYYKRLFANVKLDQKLGKKFNFSLNTRFSNEQRNGDEGTSSGGGSLLSTSFWFRPIATQDVLGELNPLQNSQIGFYDNVLQDFFNPVNRINDYNRLRNSRNLVNNLSLSWDIIKGLTAKTDFNYGVSWGRNRQWTGAIYNNYLDAEGNKTYAGDARLETSEGWKLRWVNTLNYSVNGLGNDQRLNFLVGTEMLNSGGHDAYMSGRLFPASFDSERAFANMDQYLRDEGVVTSEFGSSQDIPNRLMSFFGRANYSILDKYLFNATFRADGSSRFAPSNRWGYFPAASFAWRLSREAFMANTSWVDDLKLRVSYGAVGNDGINALLWTQVWKSGGLTRYSINENRQVSYVPNSEAIANPNLKWETTVTRNLGLDYTLLNNRVYGTIDVYKNTVNDLLLVTPVSPMSGFEYTFDNIGATSNRGVEVSVNGDLVRRGNFSLRAGVNVSVNRGKIEELIDGVTGLYSSGWAGINTYPRSGDYILEVGQPVGLVRGWVYDGWYTTDDFNYADGIYTTKEGVVDIAPGVITNIYGTLSNKPGGQTAYPGVPKFKDISGPEGVPDGVVDENDITIIGNMNPKHTGGFYVGGNYKNFDFALDFNWSYGNDIYNATHIQAYQGSKEDGLYRNRLAELAGHYRIFDVNESGQMAPVTDPAALAALNANASTFLPYSESTITSTFGIEDGSFLRLNTFTVGYSLPAAFLEKVKITKFRIYGSIFNALTLTGYSGLDPEVSTNNSASDFYPTPGLDYGAYPRPRSYTLGLNLQF